MSTATPIIRSTRDQLLTAAAGQTVFTFTDPLFDTLDLEVSVSADGVVWTVVPGVTLALLPANAGATATFAVAPRPTSGDPAVTVRLRGRRVHERVTDVTRAGVLRSAAIESELDRISTVLQELRRDVEVLVAGLGASIPTSPGSTRIEAYQYRKALVAQGKMTLLLSQLPADPESPALIAWETGADLTWGDSLWTAIKAALAYSDAQMSILMNLARSQTL
jgi:hypothetical protein